MMIWDAGNLKYAICSDNIQKSLYCSYCAENCACFPAYEYIQYMADMPCQLHLKSCADSACTCTLISNEVPGYKTMSQNKSLKPSRVCLFLWWFQARSVLASGKLLPPRQAGSVDLSLPGRGFPDPQIGGPFLVTRQTVLHRLLLPWTLGVCVETYYCG